MIQLHFSSLFQLSILTLKCSDFLTNLSLIVSGSLFHKMLPLNDSELFPYNKVLVSGAAGCIVFLHCYVYPFCEEFSQK